MGRIRLNVIWTMFLSSIPKGYFIGRVEKIYPHPDLLFH